MHLLATAAARLQTMRAQMGARHCHMDKELVLLPRLVFDSFEVIAQATRLVERDTPGAPRAKVICFALLCRLYF